MQGGWGGERERLVHKNFEEEYLLRCLNFGFQDLKMNWDSLNNDHLRMKTLINSSEYLRFCEYTFYNKDNNAGGLPKMPEDFPKCQRQTNNVFRGNDPKVNRFVYYRCFLPFPSPPPPPQG